MELGGKYMDMWMLAYQVGSLIPAIALGIHACKLSFAKSQDARKTLCSAALYKWIAYFYCAVLAVMALGKVYSHFQHGH